jgi:iron(III) transport system substrate-binding protein
VTPSVQGYPADFEQRLVNVNFREMGAQRERILAEWTRRFDNKSAPRN